jgi:hypothetical protein
MRTFATVLIIALGAAALGACNPRGAGESASAPISASAASPRKAGLWEQRVSNGVAPAAITNICLDPAAEGVLTTFGRQANARCEKSEMKQGAQGVWSFATVCDIGGAGKVSTVGEIKGDFISWYQVKATSTVAGQPGEQRLVMDASWKSACPEGMKPGDVVTPDGARHKVADMAPPASSR